MQTDISRCTTQDRTYTNNSQGAINDPIEMSQGTPPKSPPRPPNPNIFFERWSLTSSSDIDFSLYLIFFLSSLLFVLTLRGDIDEMIEWNGEDEE
jgi:hypothetical protein